MSGIVGRAVRDAITCSSIDQNSTARQVIKCDKPDGVVLHFDKDMDTKDDILCSGNDPTVLESEECMPNKQKRPRKMMIFRGPALFNDITVFSTSR